MFHKFALFSSLVLTATCTILHQAQLPIILGLQYDADPNYNFAYEVNDAHTGDIKSQQESRRGDTVLGQYSLLQPDGVRRIVDYRADDHIGFQATVNNNGQARTIVPQAPQIPQAQPASNNAPNQPNYGPQSYQAWPTPSVQPPSAPTPVAVSRSSFVQTISHGPVAQHPWA